MADKEKIFLGRTYDANYSLGKIVLEQKDIDLLVANMTNGKVSILLKEGKSGKKYAEIDTWVAQSQQPVHHHQPNMQNSTPVAMDFSNKPDESKDSLPF